MAVPGFSERISRFLQVDRRDGHVSFCYAAHSGWLTSHLRYIDTKLQSISRARGKERARMLADLTQEVVRVAAEETEIDEEWTAHLDSKKRERLSIDEPEAA